MNKTIYSGTKIMFKTLLPVYKYEFKWEFENFSGLTRNTKIPTPYFSPIPEQEWYVEFQKSEHFYAYLCSKNIVEVKIVYETILCDNSDIYHTENGQTYENGQVKLDLIQKLPKSLTEDLQNLPNDVLILKCSLKFYKIQTPTVEMIDMNFEYNTNAVDKMLLNLSSMFENSEHCDVTLKVEDGVSIETHKAILCASSPIFAKMFNHNLKETTNNIIDIKDISGPIMKKFISLLYCPILKEHLDLDTACNLYYVFDKYEVLSLRSMVSKELINLLNNENALEILSIADQHNDDPLKEKIVEYVRFNLKSIVKSDSWDQFVINKGKLASALITNYFKEV